jgi:hypothetical protein
MQYLTTFDALGLTPQVVASRDGPSGRGPKRARDAGGCSDGQTHSHKSRRISRVMSDGKQLAQVGLQPRVLWPFGNMCKASL